MASVLFVVYGRLFHIPWHRYQIKIYVPWCQADHKSTKEDEKYLKSTIRTYLVGTYLFCGADIE